MAEYTGYSSSDWARSAATSLANHTREEQQAWLRNYQIGALLESKGRISYNHGGRGFTWDVRYRGHNIEGNTGETARNFARRNLWKVAALPYRGYQATDAIYKKELLENRGEAAIVKLWDNFVNRLDESIRQGVATEFYIDGNASGNETAWHGLESIFGATQTITEGTAGATGRTANAADRSAYPNDTYATLSTVLGAEGGEGDSVATWPGGVADSEFDYWSPLIVNYTSSAFGGAADTWAAQGDEAMRFMIIHGQRNSSVTGQMTNILLNRNLYFELLNLLDGKEQININPGATNELKALGFKNVVEFDGVSVSWETGMPANVGYGLNYQCMELRCMEDELFKSEGPEYDIDTQAYKAVVYTLSNIKLDSPRNFGKLATLA